MKRYTAKYWFMNWDDKDCMELETDSLQEAIDFVTHIPSSVCTLSFSQNIYDNTIQSPLWADKDVWNGRTPAETEVKRTVARLCADIDAAGKRVEEHAARSVERYKEMVGLLRPVPSNPATPGFGGDHETAA